MEGEHENEKKIRELNVKLEKLISYVKEKKKTKEDNGILIKQNTVNTNVIKKNKV